MQTDSCCRFMHHAAIAGFAPSRERVADEQIAGMERALASFHAAVAAQYGAEQAALASADWIDELSKLDHEQPADWRSITIAAARRLAHRVTAEAHA